MQDPMKTKQMLLEELMNDASAGVGGELKAKYAPPAPEQAVEAEPMGDRMKTEVSDPLDGSLTEKIGVNGPGGSSDVADPEAELQALIASNPALRKLLGLDEELNGGI